MKNFFILFLFILFGFEDSFCVENIMKTDNEAKINLIKKISSFNEVDFNEFIQDKDNLVLFDVDHTILKPLEIYEQCYLSNDEKCVKKIAEIRNLYGDQIDQNFLWGKLMKKMKVEIIENDVIEKIEFLKKNNIPCISITGIQSGFNLGLEDSWQNWRFLNLKNLGIEFSFSDLGFVLDSSGYTRPIFFRGIIFTDYESKGNALKLFLKKINQINELNNEDFLNQADNMEYYKKISLKPKRIIMFDDSDSYLESVSKACSELGIEFLGFHYKPYEISDWSKECETKFQEEIKGF